MDIPEVKVRFVTVGQGVRRLAKIDDCPYCHMEHTHEWAEGVSGPQHRVAHCAIDRSDPRFEELGIDKGYMLIEPDA